MKLVKNCVDMALSSSAQSFCVNLNNHHNQNHAFLFCRFEGFACKFLREWFFMAFCQADEDGFHKLLENDYEIAVGTAGRSFPDFATQISQIFWTFSHRVSKFRIDIGSILCHIAPKLSF